MRTWRFGSAWSESEIRDYLRDLANHPISCDAPPDEMTPEHDWMAHGMGVVIGFEPPGRPEPGGLFEQTRTAIFDYHFSDSRIVTGYFDPSVPLGERNVALEFKTMGFRFLNGVRVTRVLDEEQDSVSRAGFRYDTLAGHMERGYEWFLATKDHRTGEVTFQMIARLTDGDYPIWWSRLGFALLGDFYRSLWRRRAADCVPDFARGHRAPNFGAVPVAL